MAVAAKCVVDDVFDPAEALQISVFQWGGKCCDVATFRILSSRAIAMKAAAKCGASATFDPAEALQISRLVWGNRDSRLIQQRAMKAWAAGRMGRQDHWARLVECRPGACEAVLRTFCAAMEAEAMP